MKIVYLNGNYLPIHEAQISVLDRGFLFGDGVYEVIPAYGGKLFLSELHLQRLQKSLQAIHLQIAMTNEQLQKTLQELVRRNEALLGKEQTVYLQITRGATQERQHLFPEEVKPTIFAMTSIFRKISAMDLGRGFAAITAPDIRWQNCYIKSINLLPNLLLYEEAKTQQAQECILIRDGKVMEGSTSNVFIVKDNCLMTPPLSENILAGITRQFILNLAKQHHLPYKETTLLEEDLFAADEVWLTGTTKEIYPIVKLNQKTIGSGKPGKLWQTMLQYYHEEIKKAA